MGRATSQTPWLRARLVVLSDRRPAPGAPRSRVEAAIEQALREHDGVWVARWADGESGRIPVAAPERDGWGLFDPAPTDGWASFASANESYAERIAELAHPDGAIWLHGHRWMLVAPALRAYGHRGPIGLWLDVPFPEHARLAALPWGAAVLAALRELDLVGFRAAACAGHFEACRPPAVRGPAIGVFADGAAAGSFLQRLTAARRDSAPAAAPAEPAAVHAE